MLQQSLSSRVADTLRRFSPFNLMTTEDLILLSQNTVIQYVSENNYVFNQEEKPKDFFFFIKEGSIKLYKQTDGITTLHNECDEGDCFGVRQLFTEDTYWFNAQASEETLLYAIPIELMKTFLQKYPKLTYFFAQIFSANISSGIGQEMILVEPSAEVFSDLQLSSVFSIDKVRKPVTCLSDLTVQAAAILMTAQKISSIIVVDETQKPLGILSDSTLRRLIATGKYSIETSVAQIMTKPAACTKAGLTLADIQIQMIQKKVRYLCVTEDGTNQTTLQGIVSEHDLIIAHGNNPAVLFREIQYSNDVFELKKIMQRVDILLENYLNMDISVHFVANIIAELNDAFTRRAVEIATSELIAQGIEKPENVDFCWLTLGSGGRREQLRKTDQDNALIFSNVAADKYNQTKDYFLRLAQRVTEILNIGGFEYCIGEMMASNPLWCLSLEQWQQQFRDWIDLPNPKSMLSYKIFFDFRVTFGNENLGEKLSDSIFAHLKANNIFLTFMAKDASENPPPLSFFRNLIVEKNGEHKDKFNIKARGLTPVADVVRALVLGAGIRNKTNTIQRLEAMAELEPQNKELYMNVAKSYQTILKFRAKQGLKNKNSGKYIMPNELDKLDRLLLRQSFKSIEDLQHLIGIRYAVGHLRL
jgi:CBS domain-containing protein